MYKVMAKQRHYRGPVYLATGSHHTCVTDGPNGTYCWGDNEHGQIGDGTTVTRDKPTAVVGLNVETIATGAGDKSTCAVTAEGALKCWGANNYGQLGDGSLDDSLEPAQVHGSESGVTAVSVGSGFACAIRHGGVVCWGMILGRQTVVPGEAFSRTPIPVVSLESNVDAISAGALHACAIVSGSAKCWGDNSFGQIGDGTTTSREQPTPVTGLESGVSAISAGGGHTCAIVSSSGTDTRSAPKVMCWGKNTKGQIGDGTTSEHLIPVLVYGLASDVSAIASGSSHTCALMRVNSASSRVACWGSNKMGQIGDGSYLDKYTPTLVEGLHLPYTAISSGAFHMCVASSKGSVACWGNNRSGQLGYGYRDERAFPADVD